MVGTADGGRQENDKQRTRKQWNVHWKSSICAQVATITFVRLFLVPENRGRQAQLERVRRITQRMSLAISIANARSTYPLPTLPAVLPGLLIALVLSSFARNFGVAEAGTKTFFPFSRRHSLIDPNLNWTCDVGTRDSYFDQTLHLQH